MQDAFRKAGVRPVTAADWGLFASRQMNEGNVRAANGVGSHLATHPLMGWALTMLRVAHRKWWWRAR